MTLQYGLEASFREGLLSGNIDVLRECLRTYATIDKTRDAENLFRSCIVKPYMDEVISEQYITQHKHGLQGMYNAILDFFPKHYAKLREITTGAGSGVVSGYDFVVNAVWPEVIANVEAKTPSIFAPGNPNVFHEKYSISIAFVERFERQCSSQASVKQLRAHASYSVFMSKWSLSVYFQIRFQEIAGAIETALYAPFAEATEQCNPSFLLQCTVQLWQSLQRCWDDDVYLPPLCHRFWKLTLQLVSRYATWVADLQDEANKSFAHSDTAAQGMVKISSEANFGSMYAGGSGPNHSASMTNLAMTTSTPSLATKSNSTVTTPTVTVTNLVAVITDIKTLVAELPNFFTATVVPMFSNISNENIKLLRASMQDSEDSLTSQLPQLESYITVEIVSQCVMSLKAVNDIPRLYRRTNRDVPAKASVYVAGIVRPIVDFLEDHKDMLHEETRRTWAMSIMQTVCEQYLLVTSDVLTSVKKMEESLRRLRTARGTSSANSGSQGMSDDDKIRLQLCLDVKELSTQMGVVGLSAEDIETYSRLSQLVNSAVQSNAT